jgi:hypothetical protein
MSPTAKKATMYDFVLTNGAMMPAAGGGVEPVPIERGGDPVNVSVTRQLGHTLVVARRGHWAHGKPADHNLRESAPADADDASGPGPKTKKTTRGPSGV